MSQQVKVRSCLLVLTMLFLNEARHASQMRPLTIEDCVRTRRIVDGEVKISPDGLSVAYVVKSPDTVNNRNNYQLYIRDLRKLEPRGEGRLLIQADKISGIRWFTPGKVAALVSHARGKEQEISGDVTIVDVNSGEQGILTFPMKIRDYDVSADGKTIVFSTAAPQPDTTGSGNAMGQNDRELRGYRVPFGHGQGNGPESYFDECEIYVGRMTQTGIQDSRRLEFNGPDGSSNTTSLAGVANLNLSPDGRHLLLRYVVSALPEGWQDHPLAAYLQTHGALPKYAILGLYDFESRQLRRAFNFVDSGFYTKASWASDSNAFAVVGPSPIDTREGETEARDAAASGNALYHLLRLAHVFSVDERTGKVARILSRDSGVPGNSRFANDTPLWWNGSDGEMLVRSGIDQFVRMSKIHGEWKEVNRFEIPDHSSFVSSFTSEGNVVAGISQSLTIPPDIFVVDIKAPRMTLVTNLNPDYSSITLGHIERIEWTNRYGSHCKGMLIKPVNYVAGKRYPLVLMASNFDGDYFISDSLYTTAFAPQSLANVGFLVLMAKYSEANKAPKSQFPGGMAEAYDWMSMQESAIDFLADRGMADKSNVGIVGFSRTSWLTDFTLTHSTYKFAAASSADSGTNTYGGYFRYNDAGTMNSSESQVGGPPYGDTLRNWLKYAPPFNASNVQAPILMEYTRDPKDAFEFFVALARQGKPVELYNYPKGAHPLDTPFERLASLQRNVDWFRFWMQGYEGKAPKYDPDQYIRWHKLREQQEWNKRMRAQGKDPAAEYLRKTISGAR